jgi:hypothetical protein
VGRFIQFVEGLKRKSISILDIIAPASSAFRLWDYAIVFLSSQGFSLRLNPPWTLLVFQLINGLFWNFSRSIIV